MLYVREITDLMAAYPGRDFKKAEIVNYIAAGRRMDARAKNTLRCSTLRALQAMIDIGVVAVHYPRAVHGGFALYQWIDRRLQNMQAIL
jgi:hypothetical protein